ncbi:TRAP transporter small permease [Candidatus Contubernalis alkalaceticus]|nr:TRAP transporter small permease [Candidatus Contubernalis alkalaceticus]
MEHFSGFVTKLSSFLDKIAGLVLVSVMFLVVANVILRELFKSPILGTYEYVGFFTASLIGLAIAYCALKDFHISVGFMLEKLSPGIQQLVEVFIGFISFIFLLFSSWHIMDYAGSMIASGEVSPTTRTPFYPFIYVVAVGFVALCLVVLLKLTESIRKVVKEWNQ